MTVVAPETSHVSQPYPEGSNCYNQPPKAECSIPVLTGLLQYAGSEGIRAGLFCTDQSARDLTGFGVRAEDPTKGFEVRVGDNTHEVTAVYARMPDSDVKVPVNKLPRGNKLGVFSLDFVWYADSPEGFCRFVMRIGPVRNYPHNGGQSVTQEKNGNAVSVGQLNFCTPGDVRGTLEYIDQQRVVRAQAAEVYAAERDAGNVTRVDFGGEAEHASHREQGVMVSNIGRAAAKLA